MGVKYGGCKDARDVSEVSEVSLKNVRRTLARVLSEVSKVSLKNVRLRPWSNISVISVAFLP